jgi:hypothetical protein
VAPDTTILKTSREQLLEVAEREGWHTLIDLGLHVVLQRGERRFAVQFDLDGRCTWCQDGWEHLRPLDSAIRILIDLRPPRPKQGGHL